MWPFGGLSSVKPAPTWNPSAPTVTSTTPYGGMGMTYGAAQSALAPPSLAPYASRPSSLTPPTGLPGGFAPATQAPSTAAAAHGAFQPGMAVEAEWMAGTWHRGVVQEVDQQGRLTIQYSDGYKQRSVELGRVRPISSSSPTVQQPGQPPAPQLGPSKRAIPPPPSMVETGPPGPVEEDDEETAQVRRKLQMAMQKGHTDAMEAALSEARNTGIFCCPETTQVREALVQLEAREWRQRAAREAEEAVDSETTWWKLQGAMTLVSAAGLGQGEKERIGEAQKAFNKRATAIRGLKSAAAAKDATRLRTAIEVALQALVQEPHIGQARQALRNIESQHQARLSLRRASDTNCMVALKASIETAADAGLKSSCETDSAALQPARSKLRNLALERLESLAQAEDVESLSAALKEAGDFEVPEAEVMRFQDRLHSMQARVHHREQLFIAVKSSSKEQLQAALRGAELALAPPELEQARQALRAHMEREQQALTMATAAERLQRALQGENPAALAEALSSAEAVGLGGGAEAAFARERIRYLQSRSGAGSALREAAQSGDIYRLRAAIAAARGSGANESELSRARDQLRRLEAQARWRQETQAAQDADALQRLISEAPSLGMPRNEVTQAETKLQAMKGNELVPKIRHAVQVGDAVRLRSALDAACACGQQVPQSELEAGWAKLRELESGGWALRELQNALQTKDPVRLDAALRQAEAGGVGRSQDGAKLLQQARRELQGVLAKQEARQEIQLARASCSFSALAAARQRGQAAGLDAGELPELPPASPTGYMAPVTDPQHLPQPASYGVPQTQPQHFGPPVWATYGAPLANPQLQAAPGYPSFGGPPTDLQLVGPPTDPQPQYAQDSRKVYFSM